MSIWGGVLFTKDNTIGFTLIELLAVIVILAVIALIATPIVLNIIEQARYGAAKSSAIGYVEASEKAAILYLMENRDGKITGDCTAKSNVLTCGDNILTLDIKGSLPSSGTITFDSKGNVNGVKDLTINGYKFSYSNGEWTGDKSAGDVLPPKAEGRIATKGDIEKYVKYNPDNATWDAERDGVSETKTEENGKFDIYNVFSDKSANGDSKNKGIACDWNDFLDYEIKEGWQIINVSDDGQITLIHAGIPECYYHAKGQASYSETLLKKVATSISDEGDGKAWTKYGNSTYADSVHYMDENDFMITTKNAGNEKNLSQCYRVGQKPCVSGLASVYFKYYFAAAYDNDYLYLRRVDDAPTLNDDVSSDYGNHGVRPVIILKSNVKITEDGMDGSKAKPYNLTT